MATSEQTTPEARIALAVQQVHEARERADYHNWSGGTGRQYAEAVNELRAARKAATSLVSSPDERADAGRGAFIFALIATLIAIVGILCFVVLR